MYKYYSMYLMDTQSVARKLGMTMQNVYYLIKTKKLVPAEKDSNGMYNNRYLFDPMDVERYKDARLAKVRAC